MVYKLLEFDKILKIIQLCKLFLLDRNTCYDITICKIYLASM